MKDQEASNHFGTMCNIYVIYPHVIMLGTLYIFLGINHVMVIISKSLVQFFFPYFPSMGSDDPPPPSPLGVENVKIRENSEKSQGTSGGPLGPSLVNLTYSPFKQICQYF